MIVLTPEQASELRDELRSARVTAKLIIAYGDAENRSRGAHIADVCTRMEQQLDAAQREAEAVSR